VRKYLLKKKAGRANREEDGKINDTESSESSLVLNFK
jgi:hypothetical protein